MINKQEVEKLLNQALDGKEIIAVLVKVSPGNKITVLLDGANGVSIDDCAFVSRRIEKNFDRDTEDFELEVSSFGIGNKLLHPVQYKFNLGRNAKCMLPDGKTFKGKIIKADDSEFQLETLIKGKKKSENKTEIITLKYNECRETKIVVSF